EQRKGMSAGEENPPLDRGAARLDNGRCSVSSNGEGHVFYRRGARVAVDPGGPGGAGAPGDLNAPWCSDPTPDTRSAAEEPHSWLCSFASTTTPSSGRSAGSSVGCCSASSATRPRPRTA